MQQRARRMVDSDDDDDVQDEVTETIEKFVQTRHVQTLKYLQHVIDENRHLRLHLEHLKRRQTDPLPSPDVVDPIDPEDPPITEISFEIPDVVSPLPPVKRFVHVATNTVPEVEEVKEDFQGQCQVLQDELVNVKKEHQLNREEFHRELSRVDGENVQLTKEIESLRQQVIVVQQHDRHKQAEIVRLTSLLTEQHSINESSSTQLKKLDQTNRLLLQSLTSSEETRLHLESQLEQCRLMLQQTEGHVAELQSTGKSREKKMQTMERDMETSKEQLERQLKTIEQFQDENGELKETIQSLEEQLRQRIFQEEEEKIIRDRERQQANNFKDFVQVKRTLQISQQENEQLKLELKKLQLRLLNKSA